MKVLCKCGCNQETTSPKNKYLWGHGNGRVIKKYSNPILCRCGCGKLIDKWNPKLKKPVEYLVGHNARVEHPSGGLPRPKFIKMTKQEWSKKMSILRRGKGNPMYGKKHPNYVLRGHVPWNKGKIGEYKIGTSENKMINTKRKENHWHWKGGRPKCIKCGKQLMAYGAINCKMHSLQAQFQDPKKISSIEKKLYEELKNRGLLFEIQKLINGKFIVDAYIPSLNLIIEADGDYWHNLDRVIKKDKAENAYLTKCGYKLLRLKETEIVNGSFKQKIKGELN